MKKPILDPNHIKLITIDKKVSLFFHTETLQIYPIKDHELLRFLKLYSENDSKKLSEIYTKQEIKEALDFICSNIIKAPATFFLEVNDTQERDYNAIVFPIAAKCNLCCPYCFARTDDSFKFGDYTAESVKKNVDFGMTKNSQVEKPITITFFGGEPLLNIEAMKYTIQYIKEQYPERKVSYSMTTNGTILNDDIIKILKENKIIVLVSIDGPNNEYNLRHYKNGTSSVDDVISNIAKLQKNGIYIEIRATLVCNNPFILESFDFFEKIGIPFFVSFAYTSENKNHNLSDYTKDNLGIITSQMRKLLIYYKDKIKKGEPIYNKKFSKEVFILRYRNIQNISCGAGRTYFTITADGDIYSCAHFMNEKKFKIGNIEDDEKLKKSFRAVQIKSIKGCDLCWAKYLCLGGCFAQKISLWRTEKMQLPQNQCELELLSIELYLKLYYYANIYNKEKYLQNPIEMN